MEDVRATEYFKGEEGVQSNALVYLRRKNVNATDILMSQLECKKSYLILKYIIFRKQLKSNFFLFKIPPIIFSYQTKQKSSFNEPERL